MSAEGAPEPPRGVRSKLEPVMRDVEQVRGLERHRTAKPHRCDAHLEDVFQNAGDSRVSWASWRTSVRTYVQCLRAEPGSEPPRTRGPNDPRV